MANSFKHVDNKIHVGDTVKVHYKFKEGDKMKSQIFQGIIMGIRGRAANKMFTVRKVTRDKIGVERIFPLHSPFVAKVTVAKRGRVRRSKLNFIRNLSERELRERLS